jgi:hypothetical protein
MYLKTIEDARAVAQRGVNRSGATHYIIQDGAFFHVVLMPKPGATIVETIEGEE